MSEVDRKIIDDVLNDWERLKKQENNFRAALDGRDMLHEIETLRESRDHWASSAVKAQLDAADFYALRTLGLEMLEEQWGQAPIPPNQETWIKLALLVGRVEGPQPSPVKEEP